jgi:hypothetical protein
MDKNIIYDCGYSDGLKDATDFYEEKVKSLIARVRYLENYIEVARECGALDGNIMDIMLDTGEIKLN